MNIKRFASIAIICLSNTAFADLNIPVVKDYALAEDSKIWVKSGTDQVPSKLIATETIQEPSLSYSNKYPHSYLQNENFVLCFRECSNNDAFKIKNRDQKSIEYSGPKKNEILEQTNVYYWAEKYLNFLEEKLDFKSERLLRVRTGLDLSDATGGPSMKDNAFYIAGSESINFLPANHNVFFKMKGGKINRSGFDPSVIIHEMSHFLFDHLFPNPLNVEIHGLNEGFADYMANVVLENPKLGLVMLQGKPMRDSSSHMDSKSLRKIYLPEMESHALGERVAFVLWKSRELSPDKNSMDRAVIDGVKELGQNPYSNIFDFKSIMLKKMTAINSSENYSKIEKLWNAVFQDKYAPLKFERIDISALTTETYSRHWGADIYSQVDSKNAEIMGNLPPKISYEVIRSDYLKFGPNKEWYFHIYLKIDSSYYWLVHNNSQVIGLYTPDGELLRDMDKINAAKDAVTDYLNGRRVSMVYDEINIKDIYFGRGAMGLAFKIKGSSTSAEEVVFNGEKKLGKRIKLDIKQRMLIGKFLEMPEIVAIELITIPTTNESGGIKDLYFQIDGQRVIGHKYIFKSGSSMGAVYTSHY